MIGRAEIELTFLLSKNIRYFLYKRIIYKGTTYELGNLYNCRIATFYIFTLDVLHCALPYMLIY